MKIAYVLHHNILHEDGVTKKVSTQKKFWSEHANVKVFALAPTPVQASSSEPDFEVFPYQSLRQRIESASNLVKSVFDWSPDIVYFRYNPPYPPLYRLFKAFPTIVEMNTDDIQQYRWNSRKKHFYNIVTRHLVMRHAKGIIYNAYEIAARSYNERLHLPSIVIGDGVDLSEYDTYPAPNNITPKLVFIGKAGLLWHGIDKILWLAERLDEFDFDVIGISQDELNSRVPENVQVHGFLTRDAYERYLVNADVALGTFGLHRIGMNETAPLKVREYLAYGLPLVLGYVDTDFREPKDYILQLPNYEDNIRVNVDVIRQFVNQMKGVRVPRLEVSEQIDSRVKEQERIRFILEVAG